MSVKVSVLMPVYKTKALHLRQAIDSILTQTLADFELLILDDCPTDKSVEAVVKSYADKRIIYSRNKKNMGIAAARNKLIDMAKGEYLAVMDHDDLCLPTRFEKQVEFMQAHKNVVLCGSAYCRFSDKKKGKTVRYPEKDADIKALLFFKCAMHHPSIMMRASMIKKNRIRYNADYISANDRNLYIECSEVGKLHNLPDVLCLYRMHDEMTSKTKRTEILQEQKKLRKMMLSKIGVTLSEQEFEVFNEYLMRGKKINSSAVLQSVGNLLDTCVTANAKTKFFNQTAFRAVCAKYLVKRCLKATLLGGVSSRRVLQTTSLPVQVPFVLKVFNLFKKESK